MYTKLLEHVEHYKTVSNIAEKKLKTHYERYDKQTNENKSTTKFHRIKSLKQEKTFNKN